MRVNEQFCKSLDKNNPSYINHGWGAKPIPCAYTETQD